MKLTKLTPEQQLHLKANKEKFVKKFLNNDPINIPIAMEVIKFVYELIKKPMPKIYIASSPMKAQLMANQLKKTEKKYYSFGTFLGIYYASWYAWYETYVDFGIITEDKFPKYFKLRKFIESNIFLTIEFEKAIIIVEKPKFVKKNDNGMHCIDGYCIQWADGYGFYHVNGKKISKSDFKLAQENKITKQMFNEQKNEEVKAAWFEILGSEKIMNILEAKEIDSTTIIHANGESESVILYKTEEIMPEIGERLAWAKFICPSTGSNYLIPVNPINKTANEAVLDTCPFKGFEIKSIKDYSFNSRG